MLMKRLKVLAVDSQYLIGMDVERILGDAFGCAVTVATPLIAKKLVRRKRYDLAVLNFCESQLDFHANVDLVRGSASHLIFSVADRDYVSGIPGYEGVPVVLKPFHSETLETIVMSLFNPAHMAGPNHGLCDRFTSPPNC